MNSLLMSDNLLVEKNTNAKKSKKEKALNVLRNEFVYRINKLFTIQFPDDYPIDFKGYEVKGFSLESLQEIISIVESKVKKGIRKSFLFCSDSIMVMSDNLTISMTEYVIYFYKKKYNINIFITYGRLSKNEFEYGMIDEKMCVYNGFYVGEAGRGFFRDSFILNWFVSKKDISEEEFYCCHEGTNRCKILVGNGPWDASIAISECTDFLVHANVEKGAIDAACDVIGELAPNAVEHGDSNCMIDLCFERSGSPDGKDLTNISIVIYDFSDKLLWTDLYEKVFINNEVIINKRGRIDKIRSAWENHKAHFTTHYGKYDFYNLMAFQKISGRPGDRADGGLGINTLIQNVQKYSTDDYCYVLSGNGALLMERNLTLPNEEDYIAFNSDHDYVGKIPDENAVMKTKFYMPGVAYNLTFYFEEV